VKNHFFRPDEKLTLNYFLLPESNAEAEKIMKPVSPKKMENGGETYG